MRWMADECVSRHIVDSLRAAGHDVTFALEEFRSASDRFVLSFAERDHRLLITEDTDFGEILFRERRSSVPGIVLIRIRSQSRHLKWPRLEAAIGRFGESLVGRYTVIEEARFRSRPLR